MMHLQPVRCAHPARVAPSYGRICRCTSVARPAKRVTRHVPRAVPDDADPLDSAAVCPVPPDQQPVREYKLLQDTLLFNWATLPLPEFILRLGIVWATFFVTLGLPVSAVTFDINAQPVECAVSASIGSLFIVCIVVLRLYLGWAHVGNRLLSATVEYEETGWYDGQIWVKTPPVLLRDRLLGINSVKPTLSRLRATLVSLAGVMAGSAVLLAALPAPQAVGSVASTPAPEARAVVPMQAPGSSNDYWKNVDCFEPWVAQGAERPTGRSSLAMGQHAQRCEAP